jgi:hypothetical protein
MSISDDDTPSEIFQAEDILLMYRGNVEWKRVFRKRMGAERGVPIALHTQFCKLKTNTRWWGRHCRTISADWMRDDTLSLQHVFVLLCHLPPPVGSDHGLMSLIVVYTYRVSHKPYAFWLTECNQNQRTKTRSTVTFKIESYDHGSLLQVNN